MTTQKYRALLIQDAVSVVRVIATDCGHLQHEFEHCGTDAIELGLISNDQEGLTGADIWLWEGTTKVTDVRGFEDLYPEWQVEFVGVISPIELYDERLPALFAMMPPEQPEDESPDS